MKIQINSDSDEGSKQKQNSNTGIDDGDVPEPLGLRYPIRNDYEHSGFLFRYNTYFLFGITFIIWLIFLFTKN